jgi:hypothetical protein
VTWVELAIPGYEVGRADMGQLALAAGEAVVLGKLFSKLSRAAATLALYCNHQSNSKHLSSDDKKTYLFIYFLFFDQIHR